MKLINMKTVCEKTTWSRSHVNRMVQEGRLPKPVQLSPHRIAWVEQEVDDALRIIVEQRRGSPS